MFTVLAVLVITVDAARAETRITVEADGAYGDPCVHGSAVDPWDWWCDLLIVGASTDDCSKVSDTLDPPEPGSGDAVIRVMVDDEPAQEGDYDRRGCEMSIRPDRIHRRLGPGSVGVRVEWPGGWLAVTIRAKLDGRDPLRVQVGTEPNETNSDGDPQPQYETEPAYVGPSALNAKAIAWDGTPLTDAEPCADGAMWVPVLEIAAGDYRPEPGFGWIIPNPAPAVTIYTCSF